MVPIYFNSDINVIENKTIAEDISSLELIDCAAIGFTNWLMFELKIFQEVHVVAGVGNNGADGLAIARKLYDFGYNITILTFRSLPKKKHTYEVLLDKVLSEGVIPVYYLDDASAFDPLNGQAILVDALFGNGLNRPLEGMLALLCEHINLTYDDIYAVDIPSGLLPTGQKTTLAIEAKATLAFHSPRLSFFAAEHDRYLGNWQCIEIGLCSQEEHKIVPQAHLRPYLYLIIKLC